MWGTFQRMPLSTDLRGRTPQVLFDLEGVAARIRSASEQAAAVGWTLAYSIKTNPMSEVLRVAREAGLAAEAISGAEVEAAVKAGFEPSRIVLGGVAKAWPSGTVPSGLFALLDDTLEGFEYGVTDASHRHHCVRVRFPNVVSRLGFDTAGLANRELLAESLIAADRAGASVGLATHDHHVSEAGVGRWIEAIQGLLEGLEKARPGVLEVIECLDLGGGFEAGCLDSLLSGSPGDALRAHLRERVPRCQSVVLEPGKSLVQAYGVVAGSVIARSPGGEVTVDASMAELPWPLAQRPVYRWLDERWQPIPPGSGTIAGRTTAETDILAAGVDTGSLRVGEVLLFGEAGAYDVSMRMAFGTGGVFEAGSDSPSH